MLQNLFSLRQFRLTKLNFFVHSITRIAPKVHPRLDLILKLCRTFPIDSMPCCVYAFVLNIPFGHVRTMKVHISMCNRTEPFRPFLYMYVMMM